MQIGEVIKELRKAKGLLQEDVAWRSGLRPDYVCKIERNKVRPNINTLHKIANGLGVKLWKIIKKWEDGL